MVQIKYFPSYADVFSENLSEYENVMFPIFSVNLSSFNEEFPEEYIHLVQFNEDPYNNDTVQFFTDYCKDRMISFSLKDSRYTFNSNLKYFDLTEDWEEYLEKTKSSYLTAKSKFQGGVNVLNKSWYKVGGDPEWLQENETPNDPDGTPMTFIAQFDTLWLFDDDCPKTIYLFYSHKHRIAVELYQIT